MKGGAYSEEGARFVFDKEKLEAANSAYKYEYFNGTSVVEKTATVSRRNNPVHRRQESC